MALTQAERSRKYNASPKGKARDGREHARRKETGRCADGCSEPALAGSCRCEKHYGLHRERSWAAQGIVGLTNEAYEQKVTEQGGTCAVSWCSMQDLVAHHDHDTGAFIAALCRSHNLAFGHLGDTHDSIVEAAKCLLPPFDESQRIWT